MLSSMQCSKLVSILYQDQDHTVDRCRAPRKWSRHESAAICSVRLELEIGVLGSVLPIFPEKVSVFDVGFDIITYSIGVEDTTSSTICKASFRVMPIPAVFRKR